MNSVIDSLTTIEVLGRTAYGENRGGGKEGMQSVLNVICNRANHPSWWGKSLRDVCLKPEQFDCWNPDDPNYGIITGDIENTEGALIYAGALEMAQQAYVGTLPDITGGATYYYSKSMKKPPYWATGHEPCAEVAGQWFFNTVT